MKLKYILPIIAVIALLFIIFNSNLKKDSSLAEKNETETKSVNRSILNLETDSYLVEITGCEEGNVSCNDLIYQAVNKENQESITIQKGRTVSTLCEDGLTPCRFVGYEFTNKGYTYFIFDTGELVVTSPEGQILLEEQGIWSWENIGEDDLSKNENSSDDINREIFLVLEVLSSIHYISIDDSKDSNVNTFFYSELQEALNDSAKLERLDSKIQLLQGSNNEVISLSGIVLYNFVSSLKNSYNQWIQYLRGTNINTVDVSEYQYQYAKLHTGWKQASLDLAEGMSYLPYIALEFSSDGELASFNDNIRLPMLTKINQLFQDILIENEKFNKETGDNYVVPIIVESYIEVLTVENL